MEEASIYEESMDETNGQTTLRFAAFDYVIFGILLSFSALIGIYYGFVAKRKQDNITEYILGGKTMPLFPIAVSLIVS